MVQYYVTYSNGSFVPYSQFPMLKKQYHRPFSEFDAYKVFRMENGNTQVFINALGVKPEDVNVSVEEIESGQLLIVEGKSEIENLGNSSFYYSWPIKSVEKIRKRFENGILVLEIEYKKPVKSEVKIVEE